MNLTQITKNVLLCLLALAALVQARGLVSTYNGFFKRARVAPANLLTPHAELACADCGAPQWDALRSRLARGLPDDRAIVFVPGVAAVAGVGSTTEKAYFTLCYALFPRRVELALPIADALTPERLVALGAQHNARLNELNNIEFLEANVFDQLRDYDDAGERFDTIVLDPPAFAKNRGAVEAALRGYKEINLRALRLLNPGGVLITCSCSYHVGEELFLEMLTEAARDANRAIQIIEKRTQGRDHPILLTVPETYYLKCVILRVLD